MTHLRVVIIAGDFIRQVSLYIYFMYILYIYFMYILYIYFMYTLFIDWLPIY